MKFQRIVQAALLATLVACSGGDDASQDAAPTTTEAVVVPTVAPTTAAPTSTTAAPATAAPTTTAAEAPESLAFSSARDVGRLFEVSGTQTTYASAERETPQGSIEDGTLVQATSVRSREGALVVQVRDPSTQESYGWLVSDALVPTSRFATSEDPSQEGELRIARRSTDPLPIVDTPGGTTVVRTLRSQEIATHGGTVAVAASGDSYLDVIDPATRTRIGWIAARSFGTLTSAVFQNQDFEGLRTRADSSVSYGAPFQTVSVVQTGCNAAQVQFTNPSVSIGLAVVFGHDVPTGQTFSTREFWTAAGGGTFYVAPGDTAVLTLLTDSPRTWYFAGLDEELRAEANRAADGSLLGEPAAATDTQQVSLPGGSCAYVPPVVVDDADYGLTEEELIALDEEEALLNADGGQDDALSADEADETAEEGDSETTSVESETTVATTSTTIAPTATTTTEVSSE